MATDVMADKRAHYSWYTFFICCFMSLGSVTYGFATGNIGITLGQPSFIAKMHLATDKNAAALEGAMTGLWYFGAFCGSMFHGWVAERWGRRASIACGCVFVIVSAAILSGSANVTMFIVFRIFNGWG